jgi:streptomycin 6-kinase
LIDYTEDFAQRIRTTFKEDGAAWLRRLPEVLDLCARRWSLVVEAPFAGLSYNYVTRVRRADGSRAVLKLGVPNNELTSEMAALEFYAGQGMVQLYAADAKLGAILLEELRPGTMLATLEDDDQATVIAAGLLGQVWRPAPAKQEAFLTVAGWAQGMGELRRRFGGGSGPLDKRLFDRAEGLFAELLASAGEPYLLHGDFHHFNILRAERAPWLVIDPKGVLGEPAYDLGAFLYNPLPDFPWRSDLRRRLARRVDILCERLGLDRQRVLGYGQAQAVLSACWDVGDDIPGWEGTMHVAEELGELERSR